MLVADMERGHEEEPESCPSSLSAGKRAVLRGLATRGELNGQTVELLQWRADSERWAVRLLHSEEAICVQAASLELSCSGEVAPHGSLEAGSRAWICGLVSQSELNGELVELGGWTAEACRCAVRVLSSGESIDVSSDHLALAADDELEVSEHHALGAGLRARVHGLTSRPDLEGEAVEIVKWTAETERWLVNVLSSGERIDVEESALAQLAGGADAGACSLGLCGQLARLQGLARRRELNGCLVQVVERIGKAGRWAVRALRSRELTCVAERHLRVVEAAAGAGARRWRAGAAAPSLEEVVHATSRGRLALLPRPGRGRCLIALAPAAAGSVLFEEEPWLQLLCRGNRISVDDSMTLSKRIRADAYRRDIITQLFDGAGRGSAFMDRSDEVSRQAGPDQAWAQQWSRIWQLNAFRYHGTKLALFLAGTLFNHSCEPNAMYQTSLSKSAAVFRAIKQVCAGEEVTLDYTTCPEPTTEARQRQLREEKLFSCRCSRCLAPDVSRSMACRAAGCGGALVPGADGAWRCGGCGAGCRDGDAALAREAWIATLVVDHEVRHECYTQEHFMASMLLAAEALGPRHWTVAFLARLLLGSACAEGCCSAWAVGRRIVALARVYAAWARDLVPTERLTCGFCGTMETSIDALRTIGMEAEAAALSSEILDDICSVWGKDDADALALREEAARADKSKPFLHGFSWENFHQEIACVYSSDSDAGRGNGVILRAQEQLRDAMNSGVDPLLTCHLGYPEPR